MKYFLDTEFIEDGKTIDLISIGMVGEDGRELYLVSNEFNVNKAWRNEWLRTNVLYAIFQDSYLHDQSFADCEFTFHSLVEKLTDNPSVCQGRKQIKDAVLAFCDPSQYGVPEFWGWYADYDWVVFCQLFGAMIDLPKDYPMYCNDLKQIAYLQDLEDEEIEFMGVSLSDLDNPHHHALFDARWNKTIYDTLF